MQLNWRPSRRLLAPLLGLATIVAFAGAVQADQPATAAATPVASPTSDGRPVPLLWKVSDDDNSIYLLGSFHLLKPSDYPLSQDVEAAFADARHVVFEVPPEELGSPETGMSMAQAGMRTDGTRLNSSLTPETIALLEAWTTENAGQLQKMQISPEVLQMFEPWFVGLMVTVTELTKFGLDPALGLDAHFAARAQQAGKPTAGFETAQQQIAFLDGMDQEEQLQFLQESLRTSTEGQAEIEKLHNAWRNGDEAYLWKELAVEMRRQFPKLYQRINVDRNDAWLPKIEARLRQPGNDDSLIVVGALHLLGEDGVVEKLRAKGYDVERICSACKAVPAQLPAR